MCGVRRSSELVVRRRSVHADERHRLARDVHQEHDQEDHEAALWLTGPDDHRGVELTHDEAEDRTKLLSVLLDGLSRLGVRDHLQPVDADEHQGSADHAAEDGLRLTPGEDVEQHGEGRHVQGDHEADRHEAQDVQRDSALLVLGGDAGEGDDGCHHRQHEPRESEVEREVSGSHHATPFHWRIKERRFVTLQ